LTRNMALARIQPVSWPLMGLVSDVGVLIVMWLGGKAVVDGRISLGAFVAFNGYLTQLARPTIALGWTLASIQRGLAAMSRVTEVLDEGVRARMIVWVVLLTPSSSNAGAQKWPPHSPSLRTTARCCRGGRSSSGG